MPTSTRPWTAPTAVSAVRAVIALPGSKSHTNRELLLGALSDGRSLVRHPLDARDTQLMAGALRSIGVAVEESAEGWTVTPGELHGGRVDTGLAGTVMRFVPPVAALAHGDVHFDGDEYARTRPMATLIDGLRQAGAEVEVDVSSKGNGKGGDKGAATMPFTVHGRGAIAGGQVEIDSSSSSQFISALLLAGARFDTGIQLRHTGAAPVPSLPHIAMTVAALRARAVEVDDTVAGQWTVTAGRLRAIDTEIEPDLSNAAPFLAAAMITGGQVTIPGWPRVTDQAGDALRHLLHEMGAAITLDGYGLTLQGTGSVRGIDADLGNVGELSPVLAALAALADSPSRLRGIGHLRGHETDRLAALATEINSLGGAVTESADSLSISPRPLHGGPWHAHADHRMAQAGAVLGLAVDGVEIDDIACTTKTLADFPGLWAELLGG